MKNKQRKRVIIGLGLIILFLVIGGISFFAYNQSKKEILITGKENSETPVNKTSAKRIFANKLKADLQDALINDSRWKVQGTQHYFQEYLEFFDGQIMIHSENEDIKNELEKNRIRNAERRKKKREEKIKTSQSNSDKYSEEEYSKYEKSFVWADDLEPADYQDIINLIRQIRPLKEKKDQAKKSWVEEKLKCQPSLTYWGGLGKRSYGTDDNGKAWYNFSAWENGKEITIKVSTNHSSLASFPF